jgi:uncharacterized phage protein (TIGR01671 family)
MREIKFRGKDRLTGQWFYGSSFLKYSDEKTNIPLSLFWDLVEREILNPETVGQYTERKDRNGKEVYEGDILFPEGYKSRFYRHVIIYSDCSFGYYDNVGEFYPIRESKIAVLKLFVIGNIHDNPELMDVK